MARAGPTALVHREGVLNPGLNGTPVTLFFLLAGRLNLHKLPAETPFDAKVAVSHAVIKR